MDIFYFLKKGKENMALTEVFGLRVHGSVLGFSKFNTAQTAKHASQVWLGIHKVQFGALYSFFLALQGYIYQAMLTR